MYCFSGSAPAEDCTTGSYWNGVDRDPSSSNCLVGTGWPWAQVIRLIASFVKNIRLLCVAHFVPSVVFSFWPWPICLGFSPYDAIDPSSGFAVAFREKGQLLHSTLRPQLSRGKVAEWPEICYSSRVTSHESRGLGLLYLTSCSLGSS